MSSLLSVKMSRFDGSPWGFRLQGGKDFAQPLVIQKVAGGSLAEKAGLQAGDAVIRVNSVEVFNLRHKEAQDTIVRAGNSFELTVQRGGGTWKPQVTSVGTLNKPNASAPISNVQPVTKTSLAARKTEAVPIGSGHNLSAKPFGTIPQVNGTEPTVKAIVNKQYNTPVGMYSEETIAETLSAQAEVLAGGVLGVNFKKNERNYDAAKSEVFKMLQEIDKEPHEPEPDAEVNAVSRGTGVYPLAGLRHVSAPETKAPSSDQPSSPYAVPKTSLPPGQNICADCERLIVGVFVRIKDKNLHVECFKCATCGTSLKNVGYYNINNKLYCDIHAKLVARHHPPAPNLEPVTVPPGGKAPAGAISAAIAHSMASPGGPGTPTPLATAPLSPQPGTMAPLPFHAPRVGTSHVHAPRSIIQSPAASAPKPFSPVSAPAPSTSVSRPTSGYYSTLKPSTQGYRAGPSGAPKGGAFAGSTAPRRGRGILNPQAGPGVRVPLCGQCGNQIRGPFITALGKTWCPDHFVCVKDNCRRHLQDIGFVEEQGQLYCEYCFEKYLAPACNKCNNKIKGDCLNAIGQHFHPECFACAYCGKLFGNNPFFLEDGLPYCEADWNELFTTKCFACGFPIEAGDRWVEALNNNYHSQCFNCSMCKKNLEGQSFYAKSGRPFCKNHAR